MDQLSQIFAEQRSILSFQSLIPGVAQNSGEDVCCSAVGNSIKEGENRVDDQSNEVPGSTFKMALLSEMRMNRAILDMTASSVQVLYILCTCPILS